MRKVWEVVHWLGHGKVMVNFEGGEVNRESESTVDCIGKRRRVKGDEEGSIRNVQSLVAKEGGKYSGNGRNKGKIL